MHNIIRSRGRASVVLLIVVALIAAACGDDDDENSSTTGGTTASSDAAASDDEPSVVTIAMPADIPNLDIHRSNDLWSMAVWWENVGEPLTRLDGQSADPKPGLAESWEQRDDTTWAFELRTGVSFHNGEPFNAEAAAFSINRIIDPNFETQHGSFFSAIAGATAEGDTTVVVTTKTPYPDTPVVLSFIPMAPPAHTQTSPEASNKDMIGTGPYKLKSRSTDEIVLEANPDYWGDQPEVDEIRLLARPEASARMAAIVAGEVDVAWDVPVDQISRVPNVVSERSLEKLIVVLNPYGGITQDPKVREAIILATDNETMREELIGAELAEPGRCQFVSEGVTGFNDDLENQGFDPERARELIQEAGAEGESVRVLLPAGRYPKAEEAAQVYAQQLEEIGLTVELQIQEFQTWLENFLPEDQSTRAEVAWVGASYDQWNPLQPYSNYISEDGAARAFPLEEYPEMPGLLETAGSSTDEDERNAAFDEIAKLICDANSIDFIYQPHSIWGARDGLTWSVRQDNRIVFSTFTLSG